MDEVILPYGECVGSIDMFWWLIIFLSTLFWVFRFIRFCYHAVQFYDIKKFFNNALKIDDVSIHFHRCSQSIILYFKKITFLFIFRQSELDNYTWHEVQRRIREVQVEQQMCVHKEQLTELDIYHRILR